MYMCFEFQVDCVMYTCCEIRLTCRKTIVYLRTELEVTNTPSLGAILSCFDSVSYRTLEVALIAEFGC